MEIEKVKMRLSRFQIDMMDQACKSFQEADKGDPDLAPHNANENWKHIRHQFKLADRQIREIQKCSKLKKKKSKSRPGKLRRTNVTFA